MLLEYGFRNFFSFREGAQVNLRFDANCPETVSRGIPAATVMVVEGNNAAGKTHVLKAISFAAQFITRSFSADPGDLIPFSSFFDNTEPSEFYVEFSAAKGIEYRYELELTDRAVIRETIFVRRAKRMSVLLERSGNRITKPKALSELNGLILRDNVSVVSTFNQYGRTELKDVYDFFAKITTNVGFLGYNEMGIHLQTAAKVLFRNPRLLEFVKEFLKSCDTGIEDIDIQERNKDVPGKKEADIEYLVAFFHLVDGERKIVLIDGESSGTKALFRLLGLYFAAIKSGHIVIYDEFDLHLHSHIIPKIINLFIDPETNTGFGQLIVSSHNDRLIDFVGRYRTILVNKENNESYLYRIDELPGDIARNDRSMLHSFHEGKLGGVPRI